MVTMNDADTLGDIPSSSRITLGEETVLSPESGAGNEDNSLSVIQTTSTAAVVATTAIASSNVEPSSSLNIDIEVFDRIAAKLLKSGLFLTALELYAELIERGKELPRLREYFDDPKNFEKCIDSNTSKKHECSSGMGSLFIPKTFTPHASSEHTFDSLDFTHYSDDDIERQGDERIAVLEFELRKAHQTINSLRACLTMSQTGQLNAPTDSVDDAFDGTSQADGGKEIKSANKSTQLPNSQGMNTMAELNSFLNEPISLRDFDQRGSADGDSCPGEDDKFTRTNQTLSYSVTMFEHGQESSSLKYSLASSIKPLEKRAINFLINEYLLANNYKLTSNTFCDENADQDFDKWDDVGLNIDRPPDLLKLYRYHWQNQNSSSSLMRTLSNATTIANANNANQSTE